MGLADAVVAVALDAVTRVPVVQINVGGAVRAGARAELWQVAGVAGLPAQGASWLQLQTRTTGEISPGGGDGTDTDTSSLKVSPISPTHHRNT